MPPRGWLRLFWGWMDEQTDGKMDRQTNGWTYGWLNGWTLDSPLPYLHIALALPLMAGQGFFFPLTSLGNLLSIISSRDLRDNALRPVLTIIWSFKIFEFLLAWACSMLRLRWLSKTPIRASKWLSGALTSRPKARDGLRHPCPA